MLIVGLPKHLLTVQWKQLSEAVDVATVFLQVLEPVMRRKGPEELLGKWWWAKRGLSAGKGLFLSIFYTHIASWSLSL